MSVTEISHNAKTKSIEASCRIFTDDLERDFKIRYQKPVDLVHPDDKALADQYIADYLNEKLTISIDGKNSPLKYIGYEIKEDAVWCYLECENIVVVKQITVHNAILLDRIKEQSNMIHVTVDGKRKSTKLDNPKTDAVFNF